MLRMHREAMTMLRMHPEGMIFRMPIFSVYRNFLSFDECRNLENQAKQINFRKVPEWLGNFSFCIFGGKLSTKLPSALNPIVEKMSSLVPDQKFNTTFFQRYEIHQFVKPHRDPKNNLGQTIIGVFGDFDGAESVIEGQKIKLNRGDVLVQRCQVGNLLRPLHKVDKVTSGTRYTLILNTIV